MRTTRASFFRDCIRDGRARPKKGIGEERGIPTRSVVKETPQGPRILSGSELRQPSQAREGVKEESGIPAPFRHRRARILFWGYLSWPSQAEEKLQRWTRSLICFWSLRGPLRASLRNGIRDGRVRLKRDVEEKRGIPAFLSVEEGPRGLVSGRNLRRPNQVQEGRQREERNVSFSRRSRRTPRGSSLGGI